MQKLLLISVIDQSAGVVIKNPWKYQTRGQNRLNQRECCQHLCWETQLRRPRSRGRAARTASLGRWNPGSWEPTDQSPQSPRLTCRALASAPPELTNFSLG